MPVLPKVPKDRLRVLVRARKASTASDRRIAFNSFGREFIYFADNRGAGTRRSVIFEHLLPTELRLAQILVVPIQLKLGIDNTRNI